jgi:hypothetical protein
VDTVYGACGCSPLAKVVKVSFPYGPGETEVWITYTYDASGRQLTSTAAKSPITPSGRMIARKDIPPGAKERLANCTLWLGTSRPEDRRG